MNTPLLWLLLAACVQTGSLEVVDPTDTADVPTSGPCAAPTIPTFEERCTTCEICQGDFELRPDYALDSDGQEIDLTVCERITGDLNVVLPIRQDVAAMPLPNLLQVDGTVTIEGGSDLSGLNQLFHVGALEMTEVYGAEGLTGLEQVDGELRLMEVQGFEALPVRIAGSIHFEPISGGNRDHPHLPELHQAESLTILRDSQPSRSFPKLAHIDHIELEISDSLRSLDFACEPEVSTLILDRLMGLQQVTGLQLASEVEQVTLSRTLELYALPFTEESRRIGSLNVYQTSLTDLWAFRGSTEFDTLIVNDNPQLTTLAGLSEVTAVNDQLQLTLNAVCRDEVDAFVQQLDVVPDDLVSDGEVCD